MLGRRDQHAAARGAVELGHDQTGDARDFLEDIDLRERVLAVGGIEHQHHIMRRLGVEAAEHPADFRQLLHQLLLVLQAPGGVDNQRVDPGVGGLLDRVEHDRRRITAFGPAHEVDPDAPCPGGELPDRGSPEGVARCQQHAVIVFLEQMRELGDGGGLARAVDPDHEDHLRAGEGGDFERFRHRAQDRGDFLGDRLFQLARGDFEPEALVRKPRADAGGGGRAEVGEDQRVLDLIEGLVIKLGGAAAAAGQIGAQPLGGLGKAPEQALGPAGFTHTSRPSLRPLGVTSMIVPGAEPEGRATGA